MSPKNYMLNQYTCVLTFHSITAKMNTSLGFSLARAFIQMNLVCYKQGMTLMDTQAQNQKPKPAASDGARLTRDNWLDEAFKAVVAGGFENVKVMALAEKLKVTRGSFYWHFTDHADLIGSLLMRWKLAQLELDEK